MPKHLTFEEFSKHIVLKLKKLNIIYPELREDDLIFITISILSDKYKIKNPLEFYSQKVNKKEIDKVLDNYDFSQIQNKIVLNINLPENILVLEEKVKIKSKGQVWFIHKNDIDPFPSQPHAHLADCNLKIDLSNGKCFQIKKHIKTLNKKEFLLLRKKAAEKGIQLPKLEE